VKRAEVCSQALVPASWVLEIQVSERCPRLHANEQYAPRGQHGSNLSHVSKHFGVGWAVVVQPDEMRSLSVDSRDHCCDGTHKDIDELVWAIEGHREWNVFHLHAPHVSNSELAMEQQEVRVVHGSHSQIAVGVDAIPASGQSPQGLDYNAAFDLLRWP
jgi:hypothetical protein